MSDMEVIPSSRLGSRFWTLNAAVWGLFVAAVATAIYADGLRHGRAVHWPHIVGRYAVYYMPWFLISPLVFWWVRRHPLARQGWRRQGWRYVLFMVVWAALYIPTESALASLLAFGNLTSIGPAFRSIPFNGWVLDSVFLLTLFGVANARDLTIAARRQELGAARLAIENAELSAGLAEARLHMLRAQLEPHFLFNALNAITGLIRGAEPETAVRAVALLSELLRYATHAATAPWVRLEEEIDFVEAYLGFQQLRHGDRLSCHLETDDGIGACWIPPLVVQPLLDNAVRHGVEQVEAPSRVELEIRRRGDEVIVTVRNRPSAEVGATSGLGVGLRNSRQRLRLIYGRDITLRRGVDGDTFVVELTVPWLETAP